jgi:hypothetical protein
MNGRSRLLAAAWAAFGLSCAFVACSSSDADITTVLTAVADPKQDGKTPCPAGTVACEDRCVDTAVDPKNCGACGNTCPSGQVCDGAGHCAFVCLQGLVLCDGKCIDPLSDPGHCGASGDCLADKAGVACPKGHVCDGAGKCELACQPGFVNCNGKCIDPNTDNAHCGASSDCNGDFAGKNCGPGFVCSGGGKCQLSCQPGLIVCGSKCVDPDTNNKFCGASDDCQGAKAGEACAPGFVCNGSGKCELSCQQGMIACGGKCVDPSTHNAYCGATNDCLGANVGVSCESGFLCSGGKCQLSCQPGLIECGGQCIDPNVDNNFCGASGDCIADPGNVCAAGHVCNGAGKCELSCQQGLIACNGKCIDPNTDNSYCGASGDCTADKGQKCGAGFVCNGAGNCQISCQPGLIACGSKCVNPLTDNAYCGASGDCIADPGMKCPGGHVCSNAQCGLTCQQGLIDCSGKCTDPLSDEAHCGAKLNCLLENAGDVCTGGHVCQGGKCLATCLPGQIVCNNMCVDPLTSNGYCGAQGDCLGLNAGTTCNGKDTVCVAGACSINCPQGQVYCSGKCLDPSVDPSHCGAGQNCVANPGAKCGGLQACVKGACVAIVADSCKSILALDPASKDGPYKIYNTKKLIVDVYCDMSKGGVTYEELAFGQHNKVYPDYSLVSKADLTDAVVQQAFVYLYNKQGGALKHIDAGWTSVSCCIKLAENLGVAGVLTLGNSLVYPATIANQQACNQKPSYSFAAYRFYLQSLIQYSPPTMPTNYFATKKPGNSTLCPTNNNPGWFWLKY